MLIRMRLRHSTIVSYLALFVALGGTSYAAVSLKANSVGSRQIRNHSVQVADLSADAAPVSGAKLVSAVRDVVTDPGTNLNIIVHGEKGDKGDQGESIHGTDGAPGATGAAGAAGPQGATGPSGPRGVAIGYGHVAYNGVVDAQRSTANFDLVKPPNTRGLYCVTLVNDVVPKNISVTQDVGDGEQYDVFFAARVPPAGTVCSGYPFQVQVVSHDPETGFVGVDHSFFVSLN